jgi:hypothetical protein
MELRSPVVSCVVDERTRSFANEINPDENGREAQHVSREEKSLR